jgi:hypothetical protein
MCINYMWLVITSGKKAAESDNKETDSPLKCDFSN